MQGWPDLLSDFLNGSWQLAESLMSLVSPLLLSFLLRAAVELCLLLITFE